MYTMEYRTGHYRRVYGGETWGSVDQENTIDKCDIQREFFCIDTITKNILCFIQAQRCCPLPSEYMPLSRAG